MLNKGSVQNASENVLQTVQYFSSISLEVLAFTHIKKKKKKKKTPQKSFILV